VVNDERRGLDKEGGGGTGFLIEEGAVGANGWGLDKERAKYW